MSDFEVHPVGTGRKIAELRDEVVELWHQATAEPRSLRECLHMTQAEYTKWFLGNEQVVSDPERKVA